MILGLHIISPLAKDYASTILPNLRAARVSAVAVIIDPLEAVTTDTLDELIAALVPDQRGRKFLIMRSDDVLGSTAINPVVWRQTLQDRIFTRGIPQWISRNPSVDVFWQDGNEPEVAGMSATTHVAMLETALAWHRANPVNRLSYVASMPTSLADATIVMPATIGYDYLGVHLYGDYRLEDTADWAAILNLCLAQDRGILITEAGINDTNITSSANKAQYILDWMAANSQHARIVALIAYSLGHWGDDHYLIDAPAADVYGARSQATAPVVAPKPPPAPTPAAPVTGGTVTMSDYTGFDATVPLQVPNYARYPWTAVYIHGVNATRILPESEQAALPSGQAILPISVPLTHCPGCREAGMTPAQGTADGNSYAAALSQRGWVAGQMVAIDWEAGTEQVAGFGGYGVAMVTALKSHGFLVAPYGTPAVIGALIDAGAPIDAVWLTYWTRSTIDDTVTQWWRARYPMFAWQWGGFVTNADLDLCTRQFYGRLKGANPVDASYANFETKFMSAGGMYQYWQHNGGIVAFGSPISQEYDTINEDGKAVRRQWYERAVFEWFAGQWPAQWDVAGLLLGDIMRDNGDTLKYLLADRAAHPTAFVAP